MQFESTRRLLYAGLAIAAASAALGCSMTPHKTEAQRAADKEIATEVSSALNADSKIFARHIDVRADDGVVHLGGYVWNDRDLYEAKQVAAKVPGVTGVVDNMQLERGGSNNSPASR
jgi:osmotically-inducible protein OsmY